MSDQAAREAGNLYDLLVDYVLAEDVKEEHNRKVINGNYRILKLERAEYNYIQAQYLQPVLDKCKSLEFKYADLLEIIPPPYETNIVQRQEILEDLKVFYKKEFGEYVIPF